MNPEFLGGGFDALRFQANMGDETIIDESFDEAGKAPRLAVLAARARRQRALI